MVQHKQSGSLNQELKLIPQKSSHLFTIKLILEYQTRTIGTLDISGEGTLILHRTKEHIFKKINALGFNYQLLSDERIKFKWIKIYCDNKELITTREYCIMMGKVFQFGKKGFELQCFVPLDELNISTVRKFERNKQRQGFLFDEAS